MWELIKLLEKNGWKYDRTKGEHHIFTKPGKRPNPVPGTIDVKSFLEVYSKIFTKAGLERLTGVNQKQLWHYASGKSKPRKRQRERIERAIHRLGNDLVAFTL